MLLCDRTAGLRVFAVEQTLPAFAKNLARFATIPRAAVLSDSFPLQWAIELENEPVSIGRAKRPIGVKLYVANFGPSRHGNLL
ncbi:MAG: hypothetical protein MI861_23090 [Pirellulales bacterium]|nr:hypothetical protein [Pirellulales bacterium]